MSKYTYYSVNRAGLPYFTVAGGPFARPQTMGVHITDERGLTVAVSCSMEFAREVAAGRIYHPPPPLTLEQAVAVLNRVGHRDSRDWEPFEHMGVWSIGASYRPTLHAFEAIALATYYETQGIAQWPGWDWQPGVGE